jgi:hypothetical protein
VVIERLQEIKDALRWGSDRPCGTYFHGRPRYPSLHRTRQAVPRRPSSSVRSRWLAIAIRT